MEKQTILIFSRLRCALANADAVEKLILSLVEPARHEDGCIY